MRKHVPHFNHFASVYDDAFENFGDDFNIELLNPTPFDQISGKMTSESSNNLDTSPPPPAILLTQNAKNGKNAVNTNLRTLKIKLATLMNHVANVMKNVEDQGSKNNMAGPDKTEW